MATRCIKQLVRHHESIEAEYRETKQRLEYLEVERESARRRLLAELKSEIRQGEDG